jgi:hypothetical protein
MFKSKKKGDLIPVVEVNSDLFTIESRTADFIFQRRPSPLGEG